MRIDNNDFRREANTSLVARMLWRQSGLSRADVARRLDLNRSTVTNIVQSLLDAGIVVESPGWGSDDNGLEADTDGESGKGALGRKPVPLRISADAGLVLGIELRPGLFRAVLKDPLGGIRRVQSGALPKGALGDVATEVVRDLSLHLWKAGDPPLLGAGIGLPGVVAADRGMVIYSDSFAERDFPLTSVVQDLRTGPVLVENDANCCAWGRLTASRMQDLQDFLCLIAEPRLDKTPRALAPLAGEPLAGNVPGGDGPGGTGVGLGVVIGGEVHYGKRYAAGEFFGALHRPGRDDSEYAPFLAELFRSLIPVVSVLDCQTVFLHGELCRRRSLVESVLSRDGRPFAEALARCGCGIEFSDGGDFDVASGAASMFWARLFAVPELSGRRTAPSLDWVRVFRDR